MLTKMLVDLRVWMIRPSSLATSAKVAERSRDRFRGSPHSARERIGRLPGQFTDGP